MQDVPWGEMLQGTIVELRNTGQALESKQDTIRAFLALPVDISVVDRIHRASEILKTSIFPEARWVKPEHLHITLKFFAELPEKTIPSIKNIMELCAENMHRFTLEPTELDAFPNKKFPKVIWLGVKSDTDDHKNLTTTIEKECSRLGFPMENKKDIPHITMARIRNPQPGKWPERDLIVKLFDKMPRFSVNSMKLIQSTLSSQGVRYKQLYEVFWD